MRACLEAGAVFGIGGAERVAEFVLRHLVGVLGNQRLTWAPGRDSVQTVRPSRLLEPSMVTECLSMLQKARPSQELTL